MEYGACKTISASDLANIVPDGELPLLSLTRTPLPEKCDVLPRLDSAQASLPAWRATLGLSSPQTQTSYQGELDAFSPNGTLLTFGPFQQFGEGVINHLILLNIENFPVSRLSVLEVYDAARGRLRGRFGVKSNACTAIPLDDLGFEAGDLPLFVCRGMSAIPLYLSSAEDGGHLSLEHTHPPASMVVHGRRWEAQKLLKAHWFSKVNP